MASATLSQNLIHNVRVLYDQALNQLISGNVARYGINGYTDHAPPAYISAVTFLEAYLNEMVFGLGAKYIVKESPLWLLDQDWLKKLELKHKLIIVPQLLFGQTFCKGSQPFQDMDLLIRIRNEMVHYKMEDKIPKYVKNLEEREIALPAQPEGGDFAWIHKLSSTEGIRWAHNTVSAMVNTLTDFIPEKHKNFLAPLAKYVTKIIDKDIAIRKLREAGLDPNQNNQC
ncbi:MAG: hypothetical protein ACYTBZ_06090 [Planctomycetota bacterium]|jgi:hypothetical protein